MRCYDCGKEMEIVMWRNFTYWMCECGCWEEYDG